MRSKRIIPFLFAMVLALSGFAYAAGNTGFSDVSGDAWYADAVAYCQERGWMSGTSDTAFSPDGTMTRSMLATVLYRQAGSPAVTGTDSFTDTESGVWYSNAVVWASGKGVINGYGNGLFGTGDPVTREQLVTILWRIAGSPAAEQSRVFADQNSISSFAADAVSWAGAEGIVSGKDGNRFDPQGNATRAEVAAVLTNRAKAAENKTEDEQRPSQQPDGSSDNSSSADSSGGSGNNSSGSGSGASGGSSSGGSSGGSGGGSSGGSDAAPAPDEKEESKLEVVIGSTVFTATLADTQAAQEFAQMLPVTITLNEYGGFEKVGSLGKSLTADNSQITTTAGDIVLYNSSNIVMFYGSNSWSYTRLAKIDDLTGWAEAIGRGVGSVSVTFRLHKTQPDDGKQEQPEEPRRKTLVAYFSATGNTRPLAQYAADILDADLYEIVPAEPYTEADLAYYTDCRADREQNDPAARPAMNGAVDGMENYDTVLIGYPIWHGQAPRIICTFLESYDFSGKTVVPFCTSGSSPYSDSTIKPLAPDADWVTGRRFAAGTSRDTVKSWIDTLNLPQENDRTAAPVFNFETGTVTLNSGYTMPINGLGTYSLTGETCFNAVKAALERGVRLIDTAYMYGNEAEVGRAIRGSGIPREEIFVITKIYPGAQYSDPEQAIQDALDKLDIGYIDMMLLHHPGANDVAAYKAMEQAAAQGKLRSIGLSNWYVEELEEFLPQVDTVPALVQNEIHPYYQENDVILYIQGLGIVTQGWYPLGGRGHTAELLGDKTISTIADAHGVSAAQVILRWNLQKGVAVIPGSGNPDHILENTQLYDFELTEDEMARINALDRNEKHDWY